MSSLVVLGLKDEAAADALNEKIGTLHDQGALRVDDMVKVTVDENGKRKVHQTFSAARGGAIVGSMLGATVGLLFLAPFAGAAVGAAGGAAVGKLTGDYGIDDDFIKQTSEQLKPGTAALFMMVTGSDPEAIEAELRGTDATIITTTLDEEAQARLKAALAESDSGV